MNNELTTKKGFCFIERLSSVDQSKFFRNKLNSSNKGVSRNQLSVGCVIQVTLDSQQYNAKWKKLISFLDQSAKVIESILELFV